MGKPDSDYEALRLEKMQDDNYLHQSGMDRNILNRIMAEAIAPQLRKISGYNTLRNLVAPDESISSWELALNLVPPRTLEIQCVRLCKDAISFTSYDTAKEYQIVVFLTRGGNFITAIRQKTPRPNSDDARPPIYTVSSFEVHSSVDDLITWWTGTRMDLGLPWLSDQDKTFVMLVVWALAVFLEEVAEKREQFLKSIRDSLAKVKEIYPAYGSR